MSSWVAPAVAAEIWGVSLEQVMEHIANGTIPSRMDGRFLFVDVAAHGLPYPPEPHCSDQALVTPQELMALTGPASDDEDVLLDLSQWREARCLTGRLRRPPAQCAD